MRALHVCLLSITILGSGCKEEKTGAPQGTPPPPSPSGAGPTASGAAGKSLCDANVGISDAKVAQLLPAQIGQFCVQKADAVRAWGDGTGKKIEDVSDLIDGAGEIYSHDYFAKRYDSLKYVDGKGTGAEVEIALTTYDKPENAYGLFSYRAVANADPDPETAKKQGRTALRTMKGGGAAALGNASALLWKGPYLVELTYSPDPTKSAEEAKAAADKILPEFAQAIGDKLMGTTELPAEVRMLPTEADGRVPLGIDFVPAKFKRPEGKADALHLTVQPYASAFMKEGTKRYRVLAFVRDEKEAARDAFAAFMKMPGAVPLKEAKDFADDGTYFPFSVGQGGAGAAGKGEGVAARKGSIVVAVVDEELAMGDPQKKDEWPRLTKEEKVERLKKFIGRSPAPAASAGSAAPAPSTSAAPSASTK
ncbi:MAG: DUF6599 family protein [Polyangiales bacterium]